MYSNQQAGFLNHFTHHFLSCLPLCSSKKSKRLMDFPYYYLSHSIQIFNEIRTVKPKPNMSPYFLAKMENDLNVSVILDRTLMFNNMQTNTNSVLKIFKVSRGMQTFAQLTPTKKNFLTRIMASRTCSTNTSCSYLILHLSPSWYLKLKSHCSLHTSSFFLQQFLNFMVNANSH